MNAMGCVWWFYASLCFCSCYCLIPSSALWDATDNCNFQCVKSQVCLILQFCGMYYVLNGPLAAVPDPRVSSELLSEGSRLCQVAARARASHRQRTPSSGTWIHPWDLCHLPSKLNTHLFWTDSAGMGLLLNGRAISECFPVHSERIKDHGGEGTLES